MDKKTETTITGKCRVLGSRVWGVEGMEKTMETTMMGYIGTTVRIHSFIPSQPKVRLTLLGSLSFGAPYFDYN